MGALRALIPLVIIGLLVFTLVDLLTIDSGRVRYLPKYGWVLLIVLLPVIGPLLWLFLGREKLADATPRWGNRDEPPTRIVTSRRRGPGGPDDDPEFLARLRREREQEERIRKLEQRLSELDDDGKSE